MGFQLSCPSMRTRASVLAAAGLLAATVMSTPTNVASATSTVYTFPQCQVAVTGTAAGSSGPTATGYTTNVGNLSTIYDPEPNSIAAQPSLFGVDAGSAANPVRSLTTTVGLNADDPNVPAETVRLTSTDAGSTFPLSSQVTPNSTYDNPEDLMPAIRLRNGQLFSVSFIPKANTTTSATLAIHRSTDDGSTWSNESATYTAPAGKEFRTYASDVIDPPPVDAAHPAAFVRALRTQSYPLELANGTILVSYYTWWVGDDFWSAEVMASTDGGQTFTRRGVIAAPTSTSTYDEAGVVQLPNGSLLAVVRHEENSTTGLSTLRYATSANGGASWTTPADVLISFDGASPTTTTGINPQLQLLTNGVVVLSSGRPDDWVATSTNGLGTGWTASRTYRNCPYTSSIINKPYHGSSGNTGLAASGSNSVVQVGDNCAASWGCPTSDDGWTVDDQYRVWRRQVQVLTPDTGKIDLAGKYAAGAISVSTNMNWTGAAHPRAGLRGAFDGSAEYWSGAVSANGAGSYVISLDQSYDLTRVGLALRRGFPETARVSVSSDGVNWSAPIHTATSRTDYALRYAALATPTAARYVKIDVDATASCDAGLSVSCAFLTEVELYTTVDSFENDPLNNRPRGYTNLAQTWVSRSVVNDSRNALLFNDGSTTSAAKGTYLSGSASSRTVEFQVKPVTLPNGMLFDVMGTSAGSTVTAYHLAVFPDASLRQYKDSTWVPIAPPGTVPIGAWSKVRISASLTSAVISVDGSTVATVDPTASATALTGHQFSSSGTAPTGDVFAVDDVLSR